MSALRVGIVGSGFGGAVHAPAYALHPRFEVVAIASPTSAERVARERKIPHAFQSVEEMLAGVKLDVVSVASPPFDHHRSVLAALAAGKHVLCEKPFALNVAQAEEMVAAAKRAGSVCAVAHEFRYTPSRFAVRELIENGHLGTPRAIELEWSGTFLRPDGTRPNSWWFQRAKGGGLSGAITSHMIDHVSYMAGRTPLRSCGYERTAVAQRTAAGTTFTSDVADGGFLAIDYGDGLMATIAVDATRSIDAFRMAVHGNDKTAVIAGESMLEVNTFVVDGEETSELKLSPQHHANLSAKAPIVARGNPLPAFVTLLDEFVKAIDGKAALLPTFAEGLATQRVLASIGYSTP